MKISFQVWPLLCQWGRVFRLVAPPRESDFTPSAANLQRHCAGLSLWRSEKGVSGAEAGQALPLAAGISAESAEISLYLQNLIN